MTRAHDLRKRLAKLERRASPARISELVRRLTTGAFRPLPLTRRLEILEQPGATREDRLATGKEARRVGCVPEEVSFYLLSYELLHIAEGLRWSDDAPEDLARAREGIEAAAEGSEQLHALAAEWQRRADRFRADVMRRYDERELARLYEEDRDEFFRRAEAGRRAIFESGD